MSQEKPESRSREDNEEAKRQQERKQQIENGIWRPRIFAPFPEVICAASTKQYPDLIYLREPDRLEQGINQRKIRASRSLIAFLRKLDPTLNLGFLAYPELAHSINVRFIGYPEVEYYIRPKRRKLERTDGAITQIPGLTLMILGADCPSVGVYDPRHKAIGVFHSGWKGTAANIAFRGLRQMREAFETNPNEIYATVGPGISSNYEVGGDVYQAFLDSGNFSQEALEQIFQSRGNGKYNLNLHQAILSELLRAGVPQERIEITSLRTDQDNDLFPSHRLEAKPEGGSSADRFAFVMALK